MSSKTITPKKDCNCKTYDDVKNVTQMIDKDVLTEMKKQNRYSYYTNSFIAHLVVYLLTPIVLGYIIYSTIFRKNKELKMFNYLLKTHRLQHGKKVNKN